MDKVYGRDHLQNHGLEDAARVIFRCEKKYAGLRRKCEELADANCSLEDRLRAAEAERKATEEENAELNEKYQAAAASYVALISSRSWRLTAPLRRLTGALRRFLYKFRSTRFLLKALRYLRRNGLRAALARSCGKAKSDPPRDLSKITKQRRKREENTVFERDVKFSILVPLYNTPPKFLEEMLRSVQEQTYKNWQLCLADGSTPDFARVRSVCEAYAAADPRIKYKKLAANRGISENTKACLGMASGGYIALLDHDDILHPSALFEAMRAICGQDADFIFTDEAIFEGGDLSKLIACHFKPDFAVDTLRSYNYICHLTVFSRALLDRACGFRPGFDGSQDHDLFLRLTAEAEKIYHIQKLLYFWRSHPASVSADVSAKAYAVEAGKRAVRESLKRLGCAAVVESGRLSPTVYRVRYDLKATPSVSIIIPNKDHKKDLKKCVGSILEKSTYPNFSILIVENGSTDPELFDFYRRLQAAHKNVFVSYEYRGAFNYSTINNLAASKAEGDFLVFLNNDTEVITPDWIEEMLMFAQRPDVGAVGAMLYYPDDTIQHAGVILGVGGVAGHAHRGLKRGELGYMSRAAAAQDLSAVTAACVMLPRRVFEELGGFDEKFGLALNDVDLCMRIRKAGYLIVFTPFAELYHYESKTRGPDDTPEKLERFRSEIALFKRRWRKELEKGDPYYNPNLSLEFEDFRLK